MASVAHVLTDLASLSGEVRRKNADVRTAIDNAHVLAKTLPATAQLSQSAELQTVFCAPFITALESQTPKLVSAALPAIVRLASSISFSDAQAGSIVDILHAMDTAGQSVDTQLKILQVLPVLVPNYELEDPGFVKIVAVSSRLVYSTNPVVHNTASAALQQVFCSLFDRLRESVGHGASKESKTAVLAEDSAVLAGDIPEKRVFSQDDLELRCLRVVTDLSLAFMGEKPCFLTDKDIRLRPEPALEILENILALNRSTFRDRAGFSGVFKQKTVPGLLKTLNSTAPSYALTVRVLRIMQLVVSCQIPALRDETELFFAATNHILLDDASASMLSDDVHARQLPDHPDWEKALVAETYRSMFSNFDLVRTLHETFDGTGSQKRVLAEALMVMNSYLSKSHRELFKNESVQTFSEKHSGPLLARATATLKTPMMDHLDRHEPPANVPELYAPYLVFRALLGLADGVSGFVFNISANAEAETIERDVDFASTLNESIIREVSQLFRKFLFCSEDQECFHMLVRALQKYIHAIGLLGLSAARDSLLCLLSECIVKNTSPADEKKGNASNLLALGESLVESLSNTIQAPKQDSAQRRSSERNSTPISPHLHVSREFNSRQVMCLRAFSNLAVSLGSTLQSSWRIVWVTLQWVDYFLNGPDDFGALSQSKDPKTVGDSKLSAQDLSGIKHSHGKLIESFSGYQYEPFSEAYLVLFELFSENETPEATTPDRFPSICTFNKCFFLDTVIALATLGNTNFKFVDSEMWKLTSAFFENLATNRELVHVKRIHLVKCYTTIINTVTRSGFREKADISIYANKSLDALFGFLQNLIRLGRAKEVMVLSCETEMHLAILETLHSLIDDYDSFYSDSWDTVFRILETAFVNTEDRSVQSPKLVEKIVSLISTSYGTLKMILDEFLATLPFNQLKSLIDTLSSFCSQKYDLNISFSSVSYFWLISDCIHSNMAKFDSVENPKYLETIADTRQLEESLQNATSGNLELYQALNIYLLSKLSCLSTDERSQVREGAIQTLFQILDVQGSDAQSWQLIYNFVFPELLDLKHVDLSSATFSRKSTLPSLNLVLSGLVSVYSKFMVDFESDRHAHDLFWTRLIDYMSALLQMRWLELNSKVFQSVQDVLLFLRGVDTIPQPIKKMIFDFWVSVPIDYDFVKPDYQESLALFNESFKDLYNIMQEEFTIDEANQVLGVFNKCARYPVLKPGVNDSAKPSKLQATVVENLNYIEKRGEYGEIQAAVIQQLAQISAFPYDVKSRIEAKLKSKFEGKLKIPTFVAVGNLAYESLRAKLTQVSNLKIFLKEDRLFRVVNDLLAIVRNKAEGVQAENSAPLWCRCNQTIVDLAARLVHENLQDFKKNSDVWKVLLECITAVFEDPEDNSVNVDQYEALAAAILPDFFESGHDDLVRAFVQKVYFKSYLYKANSTEEELMKGKDDYNALTSYDFEDAFGTTSRIDVETNRSVRMKCLTELFRFASIEGAGSQAAREYVAIRAAFSMRRFVADNRLLGRKPLPQIQEDEILQILKGLQKMGHELEARQMRKLMRLLTQSVVYADRVYGMKDAVQQVLQVELLRG